MNDAAVRKVIAWIQADATTEREAAEAHVAPAHQWGSACSFRSTSRARWR